MYLDEQDGLVLLAGERAIDFSRDAFCCPCSEGSQRVDRETEAHNLLARLYLAYKSNISPTKTRVYWVLCPGQEVYRRST